MSAGPTLLYRYRSFAGTGAVYLERLLVHRELYFAAPVKFNDPFDCRPVFSLDGTKSQIVAYCERIVRKHKPNLSRDQRRTEVRAILADPLRNPCNPKAAARLQEFHTKEITEKIGVLCFSEVADDILMWAHYADAHQGVCLAFDGTVAFFRRAQQVKYPKRRPQINPFHDSDASMMTAALLTKSDHWAYEKEWRIIDYAKGPGTYRYPAGALTGVILGAQISPENEALIRKWIGEMTVPAKVYRGSPSVAEFRLKVEPSD